MDIYQERIGEYQSLLGKSQKKDRVYSVVRLVVILLAIAAAVQGINLENWNYLFIAGGLLLLFLVLLFLHNQVRQVSMRWKTYITINENERKYLQQDLSPFSDGEEFTDHAHMYSQDLDLFGPQSLFQHLNRSATLEGKRLLAKTLVDQKTADIAESQQAVQELSTDVDFRQELLMEAMLLEEDHRLPQKIRDWRAYNSKTPAVTTPWLLYILSAFSLAGLVYWLAFPALSSFYIFLALAGINLAVVGSQMKRIKREYSFLNGVSKSILIYSKLLHLIEERNHDSSKLKNLQASLAHKEVETGKALRKLSRILDGFDQLNNVLGALIMNGLFLYHLHILRDLVGWKRSFGGQMEHWLNVVAEFDKDCSLANYAFNHSDYSYPQLSRKIVFTATDIGHPLIDSGKRVVNSIDFTDFKYVILTGSNMSGKSTFLRTLGVNMVLAKAGAPVCAREMSFYPFKLLSSMKPEDSIQQEVSYFQAEVLRLKRIRQELAGDVPCFLLLDEILRGTNSEDKRNGTRLFMQKVADYNAKGVIATHDIDIAELAQQQPQVFRARYFESKFAEGALHFDYKLRNGVCTTPNATELMRAQGII